MDALLALDKKVVDSDAARISLMWKTRTEGLPALIQFHLLKEDIEVGYRQNNCGNACVFQGREGMVGIRHSRRQMVEARCIPGQGRDGRDR